MAIKLIANYAKRLGLPGYSSHQFSVSVETELVNVEDVAGESARLYQQLQQAVDGQIQQTGFVPPDGYGIENAQNGHGTNGNGHNGNGTNGNGHGANGNGAWSCSEKQQEFLQRLITDHKLDKKDVEKLAQDMFGKGVKELNKLNMSGLIDELLEKNGSKNGHGRQQRQQPYRRQRAGAE